MEKLSKILRRTVVLNGWANRHSRRALREIESAYKEMMKEMVDKLSSTRRHRALCTKSSTQGLGRSALGYRRE